VTAPVREARAAAGGYRWVELWGWPLRLMHWLAAIALVVLILTGFFIGKPYFATSGEASSHFLLGRVRFIHFAAAGLLIATGIVRVYWLLAGNRFERWRALVPVRPRAWRNLYRQGRAYLLVRPEEAPRFLGHNPLAQFSYTAIYVLVILQAMTGFALYAQATPNGLIAAAMGWVAPLFGGLPVVRFVHHVASWAFVIFIPIHVYLSIRADVLEHGGMISSIITGGRFVPAGQRHEDE